MRPEPIHYPEHWGPARKEAYVQYLRALNERQRIKDEVLQAAMDEYAAAASKCALLHAEFTATK